MGACGPPSLIKEGANGMRTTAVPLALDSMRSPSSAENGARSSESRLSLRAATGRLPSATARQLKCERDRIGWSVSAVQARNLGPRFQGDDRAVHLHGETNLGERATFAGECDEGIGACHDNSIARLAHPGRDRKFYMPVCRGTVVAGQDADGAT